MPRKPISFELDFMIKDIFPRFTVKQFDDVSFNIKPKNQGLDYDTTGMTGKIFVGVNNDMFMQTTDITVSNNNINVLLDRNMLQKQGRAYAEVELTDNDGTITSSSFIFDIDPKIGEGGQIPGEYEGFVEKYERLISEFKTQVNLTINNCNTQVNSTINNCNTNVDNKLNSVDSLVNVKISDFEKRFNRLISSQQQDAEVIDARDGEASLKARLDRDIEKAKQVYVNVEGSNISTDSSSGYLKDVEILGNTIQDEEDLADIRSVGDKVEGQELYEIPVLSCGKNLFDQSNIITGYYWSGNNTHNLYERSYLSENYCKVKPSTKLIANHSTGSIQFMEYDKNKNFIQRINASAGMVYTVPSEVHYLRFSVYDNDLDFKLQIEEGTVATPYEPYVEDKITILSPVQLEKVGDVADRIVEKEGVWGVEKNVIASVENGVLVNTKTDSDFTPLPHDQQVKLRTFANKTNISFLTEIEGTIKAQVPKSLGATVNTHTEQISNLNKELDRVKKLEESTVSTVETESDFTTVEATSNGYFEDVKLEGKTLVNCLKLNGDWFDAETTLETSSTTSTGLSDYTKGLDLSLLKDNTTYTVIPFFDYTVVTQGELYIQLNTEINGVLNVLFRIYENMFNKPTLITTKELTNKNTISLFIGGKSCSYKVRSVKILVLEGDHTQNPPSYFEGLKSVGQSTSEDEIVVSSVNGDGNLFDAELKMGNINNGIEEISTTQFRSDYVRVKSNTSYITNSNIELKYIYTYFYDKNKNYIGVSTTNSFTTPSNCMYIRVKSSKVDASAITKEFLNTVKIGLVMSKVATPYTPHQADKKRLLFYDEETQTWEKPILREWDSIEKHSDGKYYYHQRSGEVVLNGSENWTLHIANYFKLAKTDMKIFANDIKPNMISDRYVTMSLTNSSTVDSSISNGNGNPHIYIYNKSISTVEALKQSLQANNVTVVYQLAQEKVYECTNIDLITYEGETNYIVESGAIIPRSTLKVHNNISNVVSLLQKKVSLLESNITKYMITQNRMQLASTYSADSVTFKVDYALCSEETEEYNEDLYNLILNNILVGKDNYDYDKMFTMVLDYASWNQISWEQFDILVGLMDMQHNPPVEDEVIEEIPNEIM